LRDKANLQKGEKVLIHNASNGIGLAAVHYAKMVGAEIYATAKSKQQRSYLKSLGVKNVFNVDNLDFSNEILEITGGKGVHVVLGSVKGEILHQSLAVLASYGVYLETGKMNAIDNE